MTGRIAIFGYGPVGRATAARLLAQGSEVVVAQRRAPPDLPEASSLRALRRARRRSRGRTVGAASRGRDRVPIPASSGATPGRAQSPTSSPPQGDRRAWCSSTISTCTVRAARRDHAACRLRLEARGARGRDPGLDGGGGRGGSARRRGARAGLLWARRRAVLSRRHFDRQPREGKPAVFIGSPDVLHDYAYVPDIARAATSLLAAPTRPSARPGTRPARRRARPATS